MTNRHAWLATIGLTALLAAACGPSGDDAVGDDDDDDAVGPHLRIEPGAVTLAVEDGAPAQQAYTVIAVGDDGEETDVSAEAVLSLDTASLGTFAGNLLTTADRAGRTTVAAAWNGLSGESELTVILRHVIVAPGAPADARERFDGAGDGGTSPELVYPPAGVIVPPNLNTMELHYRPGAGNQAFEVTFTAALAEVVVYLGCAPLGDGCAWEPDQDTWDYLAMLGRGEAPLFYAVRGSDGAVVGVSETRSLQFSADDLLGGIYYWDAAAGEVMRYDFGLRGQSAEHFLGVGQTGASTCVGCHTLSRDGSKIAVGLDIPAPAALETYDVATRAKLWGTGVAAPGGNGANFFAFSPDASQLLASNGTSITLRNAADGTATQTVVGSGTMPDWAPDGERVAFARSSAAPLPIPIPVSTPGIEAGSILTVSAATWGGEQMLAPADGGNNYYPAYAPDSAWVVYNRSATADSFDATDARVWVVDAGGGAPIQLAAASPAPGGDSWPKWAPFIHQYASGDVMWLTFSSRRAYGLRPGGTAQIWMVGFDPARAAAGQDPGFTAFWLPFQNSTSGNHIAQWVEHVDRQPCDDTKCPGGEFCVDDECYPFPE